MKTLKIIICTIIITMLSSCGSDYDFPIQRSGNMAYSTYTWQYDRYHFTMTVEVPLSLYRYYRNLPKSQPYQNYTDDYAGHRYIGEITQQLLDMVAPFHFSRRQTAEYLLAFVQKIGYTSDPQSNTDYPRYLIETLVEHRQDCEDASAAVVSLWRAAGFYAALIDIPDQAHMAAGLCISMPAKTYYLGESGRRYVFAECTNRWPLGESPYPNDSVIVMEMSPLSKQVYSAYQKPLHAK